MLRNKIWLIPVLFFLLAPVFQNVRASENIIETEKGWRAGVAREVITPKHPMWMAGYAKRTEPSQGKLHDLWAKALALEDAGGRQAVLITTDILGMTRELTGRIRQRLSEKYGLSSDQIMINSSHTHSGPVLDNALFDIYLLEEGDVERIKKYTYRLEEQIVALAGRALRALKPVTVSSGNGVARFGVNRRNNDASTLYKQSELKGPSDYAVPVLKVSNRKGKLMAVVFGYACHPTVLSINRWSGDYPGFAQIELEKMHPGVTALFFQGAGADQNPLPRNTVALAQQYGRALAAAVDRALDEEMHELFPKLVTSYSEVELPLDKMMSREELHDFVNKSRGYEKNWAERILANMENKNDFITSYPYPLQIWQLGEQKIFSLGGELLVDYSLKLKKMFGHDIFVMGYSNDVMAYIPSARVLKEGGYEGNSSMVYGLPSNWAPGIEEIIFSRISDMAKESGVILHKERWTANGTGQLTARKYFSGFEDAHDTYNAISPASNGKIYYVLSSAEYDKGGQMYAYDPKLDKTKFVADLTDICGEKEAKAISQGKSHVSFYERRGKLYFSTHVGFYEMIDGMERLPVHPPEGYKLYPGGHIISYDLEEGRFEDLQIAPDGEGIITMTMDTARAQIYGITWPKGYFIHYNVNSGKMKNLGLVSANGEAGTPGDDYRVLCRSMFVDHRDGKVYYSTSEGDIFCYDPVPGILKMVEGVNLRLDYFGKYDATRPGSMGYNWRSIAWYQQEGVAYGVHGNSGYLFRFDPRKATIEIVDRITSEPSRKSGMFDQFSYGYLGFTINPKNQTIYYLTGGPVYIEGKRVKGVEEIAMGAARGLENLHLITYRIPGGTYTDHGPVFYENGERPTYVNSIAIGPGGNVYTLARFVHEGKIIEDLVKIPDPFADGK